MNEEIYKSFIAELEKAYADNKSFTLSTNCSGVIHHSTVRLQSFQEHENYISFNTLESQYTLDTDMKLTYDSDEDTYYLDYKHSQIVISF